MITSGGSDDRQISFDKVGKKGAFKVPVKRSNCPFELKSKNL